jgi:Flp pilus assembly protein TadD
VAEADSALAEVHGSELTGDARSLFRMDQRKLAALLMVVAGLWAYHNSLHGPFIFDDVPSILENRHIRHLWPIGTAMTAPPGTTVTGRPVVCLTLALNYALGGLNVWGYHVFNLAVHLISALVLFGIIRRTCESETLRGRFGDNATWLAAAIALVWEVHPLQTESVTYVVQRTELLMGLFLLLTLYCVIRSDRSTRPRVWQLAAVASCALGMGSKEVMVVGPLIVLLYDGVFLAPSFRELWRRRGVLYVGLASTWLILAGLVVLTTREMTGLGMQEITPWDYLKTEAGVLAHYLRLCFWPHPLLIDYFDWPVARSWKDGLVPGVVVLVLLGATLWGFRRRPWAGFLGAWFFLILAPTSSVIPSLGEVAAERRMYLPLAAVAALVVGGGWRIMEGLPGNRFAPRTARRLGAVTLVAVVLTLGWLTIRRNEVYRSDVAIWSDVVAQRPHSTRALSNLGTVLVAHGRVDEALARYHEAVQLDPGNSDAQFNLGLTLAGRNELDAALVHLNEAVRLVPHSALAQCDLGIVLTEKGDLAGALRHLTESLRFDPRSSAAHNALGVVLARQGNPAEAGKEFAKAVQLQSDNAEAQANLGFVLAQLGRMDEAVRHWETAVRLDPKQENARRALDRVHGVGQ